VLAGAGCVSNEYRISGDELRRLAQAPLESRGRGVHVLQDVGSRRASEVEPPNDEELRRAWEPIPVETQPPLGDEGVGGDAIADDLRLDLRGDRARPRPAVMPRGLRPQVGRDIAGVSRGSPSEHASTVAGGSRSPGSGSGTGSLLDGVGELHGGGGGGGNDAAAALVIVAIVAVVVAAGVAIGLVASEGTRFQGKVAMAPQQTLYIDHGNGVTSEVQLGALGPADLAHAAGAVVKDDEGYGLVLERRDPLDRTGGAFGLELGATTFNLGSVHSVGPAAEIQVGGFFRPRWGLMLDVGVSGGDVAIGGAATAAASAASADGIVTRHHLALELQAYPASLGPLHLGLFGRAGGALVGTAAGVQGGPLAGGGVLLQLELTSRMAFTLRGGVDTARLSGGWSTAGVATAGVTIY